MVSESEVVAAAFLSFLLLFSFFLAACGFVKNSLAISEIVLDDVQALPLCDHARSGYELRPQTLEV